MIENKRRKDKNKIYTNKKDVDGKIKKKTDFLEDLEDLEDLDEE
jgi:hypothetical protein